MLSEQWRRIWHLRVFKCHSGEMFILYHCGTYVQSDFLYKEKRLKLRRRDQIQPYVAEGEVQFLTRTSPSRHFSPFYSSLSSEHVRVMWGDFTNRCTWFEEHRVVKIWLMETFPLSLHIYLNWFMKLSARRLRDILFRFC